MIVSTFETVKIEDSRAHTGRSLYEGTMVNKSIRLIEVYQNNEYIAHCISLLQSSKYIYFHGIINCWL